MKQINLLALLLLIPLVAAFADDTVPEESPAGFQFIIGPRIGAAWMATSTSDFTQRVNHLFPGNSYEPITSIFGVSFEQRILLGETNSHFAFQEVVTIHGLEQSIALPLAAVLIGYRDTVGLEFGVGPTISFSGIGVMLALGWTFETRGVFLPVDVSVVLPNPSTPVTVGLTTGFNFIVSEAR